MPIIHQSEKAKRDLVDYFIYLAENTGFDTAERFLENAKKSFADLSQNPLIGSPISLQNPKLANMRKWQVDNFNNILMFYQPKNDSVSIVRVLHASQNWRKTLGVI